LRHIWLLFSITDLATACSCFACGVSIITTDFASGKFSPLIEVSLGRIRSIFLARVLCTKTRCFPSYDGLLKYSRFLRLFFTFIAGFCEKPGKLSCLLCFFFPSNLPTESLSYKKGIYTLSIDWYSLLVFGIGVMAVKCCDSCVCTSILVEIERLLVNAFRPVICCIRIRGSSRLEVFFLISRLKSFLVPRNGLTS